MIDYKLKCWFRLPEYFGVRDLIPKLKYENHSYCDAKEVQFLWLNVVYSFYNFDESSKREGYWISTTPKKWELSVDIELLFIHLKFRLWQITEKMIKLYENWVVKTLEGGVVGRVFGIDFVESK